MYNGTKQKVYLNYIQHNITLYNGIQQNDTQQNDTQQNDIIKMTLV